MNNKTENELDKLVSIMKKAGYKPYWSGSTCNCWKSPCNGLYGNYNEIVLVLYCNSNNTYDVSIRNGYLGFHIECEMDADEVPDIIQIAIDKRFDREYWTIFKYNADMKHAIDRLD